MAALRREPVRAYLYSVEVPVVGLLGVLGVIDGSVAAGALAIGAAVLGVAGIETARSKVSPVDPGS